MTRFNRPDKNIEPQTISLANIDVLLFGQ